MIASTTFARATAIVFATFILIGVLISSIRHLDDPYRCKALLRTGRWLDPPDKNGARKPFVNWQPDGCMLRKYEPADIHQCLEGRHMVFSGDSTTRQIFWAMGRLVSYLWLCGSRASADVHAVGQGEVQRRSGQGRHPRELQHDI